MTGYTRSAIGGSDRKGNIVPVLGVLFDVDDTLFDYSGSDAAGVLAHLRAVGLLDRFPNHAAALSLWRAIMEEHYARFLNGEITFVGQQHERARSFLSRIDEAAHAELSDHEASAWFDGYRAHRDAAWAAFPDAAPVLRQLAPDYRLGVVSNSSVRHQRDKLDAIGLLPFFSDAFVCSEEHGEAKPAAGIFRAGCAALGLRPDEVAYVGDKYEVDAVGALDAGLRAYWLDRAGTGTPVAEGVNVIRSLGELRSHLARSSPSTVR